MTELTQEYATDPTTGETVAIDPPLQPSDAPLMGNSVLTRGSVSRTGRGNNALYAGAAIAVIAVLAGGAFLMASGAHQQGGLMTNADATPPAQVEAAATPAPEPVAPPITTPAPAAPVLASAAPNEQPIVPDRASHVEARAVRHADSAPAERAVAARAASQDSADTAATVTMRPTDAPATVAPPQPAPVLSPSPAAPVITPPPAQ